MAESKDQQAWAAQENAKLKALWEGAEGVQQQIKTISNNLAGKTYTLTGVGLQIGDVTTVPSFVPNQGTVYIGGPPGQWDLGPGHGSWRPQPCFPDPFVDQDPGFGDAFRDFMQKQVAKNEVSELIKKREAEEARIADLVKEREVLQEELKVLAKSVEDLKALIKDMQLQFEVLVDNEVAFETREV